MLLSSYDCCFIAWATVNMIANYDRTVIIIINYDRKTFYSTGQPQKNQASFLNKSKKCMYDIK